MKHGVRLDHFPQGLIFPAELASKISYSGEQRQLQFDGFMSKTDFDKLVRLHNDIAYQRALEQLFQKCTFSAAAKPERRPKPLLVSGLAAAAFLITMGVAIVVWWM